MQAFISPGGQHALATAWYVIWFKLLGFVAVTRLKSLDGTCLAASESNIVISYQGLPTGHLPTPPCKPHKNSNLIAATYVLVTSQQVYHQQLQQLYETRPLSREVFDDRIADYCCQPDICP